MDDDLRLMKNLGKTSVQWLHAAGIHDASQLRRLGAIQAYQAVKVRGFRASLVLLYSIDAALIDKHWCDLTEDRKRLLNKQLIQLMARPEKVCAQGVEK